jgi:xanthine dehydrogenase accessory factor
VIEDVFAAVAALLASGGRGALVTIVRTNGSTPQRVGAKMLVYEDGQTVGTIGGGCYENDAFQKARLAIGSGRPQLVRYDLNDDFAEESGLICGGQMDVFIEPIVGAARLYVFGAGHVGYHVARLGSLAGFRVHVIDDREKFANTSRFPDAAEVVVDDIAQWIGDHPLPRDAYAVIVTRGHRHDLDALRALVPQPIRYLGLIGSRAKIARLYDMLAGEGIRPEDLRRVHAPIGLDLGAVTPEEIAIAIAAELIAVKYVKLGDGSAGPDAVRTSRWVPATVSESAARQAAHAQS